MGRLAEKLAEWKRYKQAGDHANLRRILNELVPLIPDESTWDARDRAAFEKFRLEGMEDVRKCESSRSPFEELIDAIREDEPGKVEDLLQRNPNLVSQTDSMGLTPLHRAAATFHTAVAKVLIDKGANLEAIGTTTGFTPLQLAVANEYYTMVDLLVTEGANVNLYSKAKLGFSAAAGIDVAATNPPLLMARKKGYRQIEELLRKHGAKEPSRLSDASSGCMATLCFMFPFVCLAVVLYIILVRETTLRATTP